MADEIIEQLEHDSIGSIDILWPIVIAKLGLQSSKLLSSSYFDYARRVYATENHIYKIILTGYEVTSRLRIHNLKGEYDILKKLSGAAGVPAAIEWKRSGDYELLIIERVAGESAENLSFTSFLVVYIKLSVIIFRLCRKGVSHNDLRLDHVLATNETSVSLIDYDQATRVNFLVGLLRSFFGFEVGKGKVHGNFMTIFTEYLKANLPRKYIAALKRTRKRKVDNELPILQENASSNSKLLLDAWSIAQLSDASSPNITLAYYSFKFESYHFPGERPWEKRWEVLRSITNYVDKRVLELGCNMSLLSCFLLREEKAAAAMCVDIDANILKAAGIVSSALRVSPEYRQKDFDSIGIWEDELNEFKPDIVFALNVLNWIQDKERFLNFLGRFDEVIFEGHDNFEVEKERFTLRGFSKISLISITERNRPVLHCQK